MYFEVFFEILVALFALFGFFSLVKLIGAVWFGYDNIRVALEVDSKDSVENIEEYIAEAKELCLMRGGRQIAVIIRREYFDELLIKKLEKSRVKYYVV